jgi:tetratricopeptide (TPR) repeat protein
MPDDTEAIRIDPNNFYAYNGRGAAFHAQRDLDRALRDFDEAIRISPDNAYAYNSRGSVYHDKRDYERAIRDFDEAIRVDPKNVEAYNNRGYARYNTRDYDRALRDHNEALRIDPKNASAYNGLCWAYSALKDYDRAIRECDESLRLDRKLAPAYHSRGFAYLGKQDYDRALRDFDEALSLNSKLPEALADRGDVHRLKGDLNRALTDLDDAVRVEPKLTSAFYLRGLVYEARGDRPRARADFEAALALPERNDSGRFVHPLARERLAALDQGTREPPRSDPPPRRDDPPPRRDEQVRRDDPSPRNDPPPARDNPTANESSHRVALVIGNAAYPDADTPLRQALQDSRALAAELRQMGFEVDARENVTKVQLRGAIDAFKAKIRQGSTALVYFSGFGVQANRQSFMIPVDAQIWNEGDVRRDGTNLEQALEDINGRNPGAILVVVDASRRNPFERRFRTVSAGLSAIAMPRNSLVIYATGVGQTMNDGTGTTSLFATELIKELRSSTATAEEAFNRTRIGVSRATNNEQVPWVSSSLPRDVVIGRPKR